MLHSRRILLAPAALLAAVLLASCGSSTDEKRSAMAVEESGSACLGSAFPVIDLTEVADPLTLTVCQLGQIPQGSSAGVAGVEIKSSNTDVVDVFNGYKEDLPDGGTFAIEGKGIVAAGVGTADITLFDPASPDSPVQQLRVLVTK